MIRVLLGFLAGMLFAAAVFIAALDTPAPVKAPAASPAPSKCTRITIFQQEVPCIRT